MYRGQAAPQEDLHFSIPEVHWFCDPEGEGGKTSIAKWLTHHREALYLTCAVTTTLICGAREGG